jgi:aspartyl-tRNA(Asn)/glutamyl-tRNA(Gln) amidotransferase subunit A
MFESIVSLAESVRSGERTAESIAKETLARVDAREPSVKAFLHVDRDGFMTAARDVDAKRARGEGLGLLAGVPIAIKDALCMTGVPTTAGSRILEGYKPVYDATVVKKLREADATLVGKTNLDEFAMGSSNENSAYAKVHNPWDLARAPGGSSGGSAAAVASRMCPGSLGSDTGGSIRQPASFCGIVGVKPTYGRVSRYGLIAFASSLDQVGPFATDVRGAARMLRVLSGQDPHDATTLDAPVDDFEAACNTPIKGLRVGIPREYFGEGLDPEVNMAVRRAISCLEQFGCTVKPVSLPHTKYAVAAYYVLATAEASSNLARFDGMRYGLRVGDDGSHSVEQVMSLTREAGFGAEVKRRIMLGTYALSSGYYDAYYGSAQKVRTLIMRDFASAFETVDVLVSPTAPTTAFKIGEKVDDPLAMYLNDIATIPVNLAGNAAMSLPVGLAPEDGLPVGFQIMAPPMADDRLYLVGAALESALHDTWGHLLIEEAPAL